ncbi:hypothetical protein MtrunA17_Chr2g0305651 [Medicago truncatula]|uniref:Uncharacterized protein n=1 Tax=Medicago truncatula TaxID=3880 RepID=A0A072TG96_MEDTR|nr:hypothetical protein MTR_0380s0030 [Medicago truncatula]RHN74059.1 hypothetical protein MtrunA17_Chr2g0305651 [Medicago truncatula]
MAGTQRRTAASHSSTSQAPRSTIQILQNRTVLILKPVNHEGDDVILGTATNSRATTVLNAKTLPPSPPLSEGVPPPPLEANKVLTNRVDLLRQQNDIKMKKKNDKKRVNYPCDMAQGQSTWRCHMYC